eukprot:jgi/Psemu1/8395/gm1.8395_g
MTSLSVLLEEAALPPIYQAWAQKSKRKKTRTIFQSQAATCAAELYIQAPLVTTSREQEAASNVAAYDTMISAEGNSLTLKDSLELQKTKAYIPLESYLAVLATILGVNHEVVQGYQNGLMRLKLQQMPLQRAITDKLGEFITLTIVVYYFQIRVRGWLGEQWGSTFHIPSPNFGKDFHEFRFTQNLHWLPNVSNGNTKGNTNRNTNGARNAGSGSGSTPPGGTGETRLPNPNRDLPLKDSSHP